MRQAKIPAVAAALRKGQSSHKQQAERARPDQGQSQGHLSNMLPERGRVVPPWSMLSLLVFWNNWSLGVHCASTLLSSEIRAELPNIEPWQTSRCTRYSQLCDQSWHSRCARPRSCLLPRCLDLQTAPPGPHLASIGKHLNPEFRGQRNQK